VWSIFAPLRRTLLAGRPVPTVGPAVFTFEADWAGVVAELGLPPRASREVVAAGSLAPYLGYRRFHKPKKDGGRREIAEPDPRLKRLQQEVVTRYLTTETPHPAAVAYQPGKSTADHVWAHAGAAVLVTADVRDFFPCTRADRVETWWRDRADDDTARLLTLLTTLDGGLPQGAPTSPALSNLVNVELDARLATRAAAAGARYTRYCDDLAFSWPVDGGPPSGFERVVRAALHEFGYELHSEKGWRVHERRDEPEVTGLVLTRSGRVRLPARLRQLMRMLSRSRDGHDLERLAGYRGYAAMVARRPGRRKRRK
jgi:RNA-directed DNA polymerase